MRRFGVQIEWGTALTIGAAIGLSACSAAGGSGANGGAFGSGKGDDGRAVTDRGWSSEDAARGDVTNFEHKWAIDLAKTRSVPKYSRSARFVAATSEELFQQPMDVLRQAAAGGDQTAMIATAACEGERAAKAESASGRNGDYLAAGDAVETGGCYYWGNTQRVNYDHTPHLDADPIYNLVDEVDGEQVLIDPPGYLNVIALHAAERNKQPEIRQYLRNGDILVYFHPEDSDTFQYRHHHAAMFYDTGEGPLAISLDGEGPFVHHIDNPTSYGPSLQTGKTSPPFHVFRFNPNGAPNAGVTAKWEFEFDGDQPVSSKLVERAVRDADGRYLFPMNEVAEQFCDKGFDCTSADGAEFFSITDEMARLYGYAARNWAFMTNDRTCFADFHELTWNDAGKRSSSNIQDEVDRWAAPTLEAAGEGGESSAPCVYCAGLVYTNLNLGLNRPMSEQGLGNLLESFTQLASFDFSDSYMEQSIATADLMRGLDGLPPLGQLVFEPMVPSNLGEAWANGYFKFTTPAAIQMLDGFLAQQGVDVSGLPDEAKEAARENARRALRAQILGGAADQIASGFYSVTWAPQWSDRKAAETQGEPPMVVSPDAVRAYANALSGGVDQIGNCDPQNPAEWTLGCVKALETQRVDNRYVPPLAYHWQANQPGSVISYVGTVIHIDMLAPISEKAELAGAAEVSEFMQGGPDTSLYENYQFKNGERQIQRVLEVNAGPRVFGPGTKITTRITANDIDDVRILLHPAGTFPSFATPDDFYRCDTDANCLGEQPEGILLPVSAEANGGNKTFVDVELSWDLFSEADMDGAACRNTEEGASCPSYDYATHERARSRVVTTTAQGQWAISVIDLGQNDAAVEIPAGDDAESSAARHAQLCNDGRVGGCANGGGHTNQWVLRVRDDRNER